MTCIQANTIYRNNPKYWEKQVIVNSVDPDQMLQNATFALDLHCLSFIQQNVGQKKNVWNKTFSKF